ncbi:MAG: type IV pilin protein [Halioglobus sp.]
MIMTKLRRHSDSGFTLIELMIVIVIVAVLVGVALPAYQDQIIRGKRGAAKSVMLDIANREVQYLLANRSFADLSDFGYAPPDDVGEFYMFSVSTTPPSTPSPPFFTITATPQGAQAKDGWLKLDSENVKTSQFPDKWER